MYETILVPTDGSEAAEAAADYAIALAGQFDATVHAIHVTEFDELPEPVSEQAQSGLSEYATQELDGIATAAANAGVSATTAVVEDSESVHEGIIDYGQAHGVDLVVMGTHGRTGLDRLLLGSTTERTLRLSPIPVLTVHPDATPDGDRETILVPTDGSDGARAAAEHAIDLAERTDTALHVVHVVDVTGFVGDVDTGAIYDALERTGQRAVDEVVASAHEAELRSVEASLLNGTPARAIVDYAADVDADLIVMGTHGRTGLDRLLLGSVTEKVVRLSSVPVLGVKAVEETESTE